MGKRRRHNTGKEKGNAPTTDPEEDAKSAPHTFIFNRGNVGKNVGQLIKDMRQVMEPYTASKLKAREKNSLKDFMSVAGLLNVTHMMLFSKTENGTNVRILKTPRGPTLTFRVNQYTLSKDVISSLRRPNMEQKQFQHHPLLVMNNFSGEGREIQLMATVFQNMFPSINVNKIRLSFIKRCVLFNYNAEDKTIEFRHYSIKAVPVGMSKGVKKLLKAHVPKLDRYEDVSEFLLRAGELSESEAELDGPQNEIVLAQDLGSRGNVKSSKSAIRLVEIGPRLTLRLVKIEEGVSDGAVLYHEYKHFTPKEQQEIELGRKEKKLAKEKRKNIQSENIKKKEEEKQRLKDLSLAGMKKKKESESKDKEIEDDDEDDTGKVEPKNDSEDDDVAYYTQEVGEAPDKDLQLSSGQGAKRKRFDRPRMPFKKRRMADGDSKKSGFKGKPGRDRDTGFDKGKRGGFLKRGESQGLRGKRPDKFSKKDSFDKKGKFGKSKGRAPGKSFQKGQRSGRGGRTGARGKGR